MKLSHIHLLPFESGFQMVNLFELITYKAAHVLLYYCYAAWLLTIRR